MQGKKRNVYRSSVGKRPLGRQRPRREDNIKMDLREMGGGMGWIHLAQDREHRTAIMTLGFQKY
jgi:hypothetical protein